MPVSERESAPRPRRIYYGWVMVLTLSLTEITSWGILYYAFSVFLTPIKDSQGWSVAEITGAYSLALLLSGVAAIPVGRWLDRHGPRVLMTIGSVAATALVVAWSRVDSLLGFYLVWAGIGLAMAAVLYEPAFQVVAIWFRRHRARALTVLTFIAGLASVIYIPLSERLVSAYGWREALLILAVILGCLTIPLHALVLRRSPEQVGQTPDGLLVSAPVATRDAPEAAVTPRDALRSPAFWWLTGSFVLAMLATMTMTVHLIPYLIDRGFSSGFAASAAGAIGLLALPGRLIFTPLGERVHRRVVTAAIFVVQMAALAILVLTPGKWGVVLFVILFGAGFGAITPARAALVSDLFGASSYGAINGVVALCITVARSIAPVGAGLLLVALGSYTPIIWLAAGLSGAAALAALRAR